MVFVHLDGHRMGPELQRFKARASVVSQGWGCFAKPLDFGKIVAWRCSNERLATWPWPMMD